MYTVYKITNKINNKKYIGITTKSIEERFKKHISAMNEKTNQIPIRSAMKEFGKDNFTIKEILITDCKEKALNLEKFYIKFYDSINNGYNIAFGGKGGDTLTNNVNIESIKEKLRESKLGAKNHNSKEVLVEGNNGFRMVFESAGETRRYFQSIGIKVAESSIKRKCRGIIKNNYIENYKVCWNTNV